MRCCGKRAVLDKRIRRITSALAENHILGNPFFIYDVVDSTNDVLKRQAVVGAPEGYTVSADQQTHGRGRMGKQWLSLKDKGLYLSVLLYPEETFADSILVNMLSAVASARALEKSGVNNVTLKWPNDVLANGRKIAGILVDSGMRSDLKAYAVVGIGVNVAHDENDFRSVGEGLATSCRLEGITIACDDILIHVLKELDACYNIVKQNDKQWVMEEWARRRTHGNG